MKRTNQITSTIISAAITVHKELGPGLMESAYEGPIEYELTRTGLYVERQKVLPVVYKGANVHTDFRVDLLVEKRVVVEVKSAKRLDPVHYAQVLTYLKLLNCEVGLLINFNVRWLKTGIHRIMNMRSDGQGRPPL